MSNKVSKKSGGKILVASVAGLMGAGLMGVSSADGAVIVSLSSITKLSDTSYRWSYQAALQPEYTFRGASGPTANDGDFFTLYDIFGYVPNSATFTTQLPAPAPVFNTTVGLTGVTPSKVVPLDDPTLPNVTVRLFGPPPSAIVPSQIFPNPAARPELILGTLSFLSTSGAATQTADGYFTSSDIVTATGRGFQNVGRVFVPSGLAGSDIPEPAALGLLAPVAMLLGRRRSR